METVYESSLAVEAHMICDLLGRAGIPARVDGEFLQGGAGELPVGNAVKVRVDPARAAEAREVIAEWEGAQAPTTTTTDPPPPQARRSRAVLWFFAGAVLGGGFVYMGLNTPVTSEGIDYEGDGTLEETYHYVGRKISRAEFDRNDDGITDAQWFYDGHGLAARYEADDDFDGRFEWRSEAALGQMLRSTLDADGDGAVEQVATFEQGVLSRIDYYRDDGKSVAKREWYPGGLLAAAEYDADDDGKFERRVDYDRFGEPKR